ncbi:MAG: CHASE4 domain-containing protein, partial [Hydrogenophaga sp.]|uniref:CHASE4 domain-containing protein n=1 Tax=Hydrogenophaga sp. TaxID=1904254 RepID=UPI002736F344
MKLQHKAWLLVVATISILTTASVLVSQHSISRSFEDLERRQFQEESERARRLLSQQLEGLTATIMDYAYWTDTVEFTQGSRPEFFAENFGTDNMKYLGITNVLVLDALGLPLAGAELTAEPALNPISETMSQMLRSLAVSVLSDKTSNTVLRTYRRIDGELYLVSIAAVRSQFKPGTAPM